MRGFIRQRGAAYQLIVYAGRDPATGKERRVTKTVRGTKREAETELGKMIGAVGDGKVSVGAGSTGELLERWYASAVDDWSPKTAHNVRRWLDGYLIPGLGAVPLRRLEGFHIEQFYGRIRCKGVSGRPLSGSSVQRVHAVLHRALAQGVRWRMLAHNPADDLDPPKRSATHVQPPTPAQVDQLLDYAEQHDPAFAVFLQVATWTGCRRGELVALTWADVDLELGEINIHSAVVATPAGLAVKGTKTDRHRRIAIGPETVALLRRVRAQVAAQALATGIKPGSFVFAEPPWEIPWHPDTVTKKFALLRKKVGVTVVRLHDLRHGHATELLAAGIDVRTVAGRLGHARASMTLDVYGHFVPAADRNAAETIERTGRRRQADRA